MSTSSPAERPLPSTWRQVLDKLVETMDDAIAAASARETALQTAAAESIPVRVCHSDAITLDGKLAEMEGRTAAAREQAGQVDAALAATAEALGQWLDAAGVVRQRLEDLARRSV
jgi:CheY-like chemotaxis protein